MLVARKTILCVDAAFTHMGVAVWSCTQRDFVFADCFVTVPMARKTHIYVADDNARRCQELAIQLGHTIDRFRPRFVYAELPVGGAKSAKSAAAMAMASAIVVSVAAVKQIPFYSFQPSESKNLANLKRFGTSKQAVQRLVLSLFNVHDVVEHHRNNWEHIADAMALIPVVEHKYGSSYVRHSSFGHSILRPA